MTNALSNLTLLSNQIHLWCIPYNVNLIDKTCLAKAELERANTFKFDIHRDYFLMYRSTLRHILSTYQDISPQDLVFHYSKYGKPYLLNNVNNIHFNLSHSSNMAILAITKGAFIGVDIEHVKPLENLEDLVKRFFSETEQKIFFLLPKHMRLTSFYEIWTRKEAYIKAIGKGLSFPLDHFTVSFSDDYPPRIVDLKFSKDDINHWSMHCFTYTHNGNKYESACVVRNQLAQVLTYEYM